MLDLKIDKDISFEGFKFQQQIHVVEAMEVGDSVLIQNYNKARGFGELIRTRGFKSALRKDGSGHRVWKLEEQEVSYESI